MDCATDFTIGDLKSEEVIYISFNNDFLYYLNYILIY